MSPRSQRKPCPDCLHCGSFQKRQIISSGILLEIFANGYTAEGNELLIGKNTKCINVMPNTLISIVVFKKECDWLSKNDKIEGFEWRGGSKRVTSGIQIWSKPFVSENKLGEKVRFTYIVLDS